MFARNLSLKYGPKLAAVSTGALALAGAAQAAVPTEITTLSTDASAIAVALTSLAVTVFAAMWIKRRFFGG